MKIPAHRSYLIGGNVLKNPTSAPCPALYTMRKNILPKDRVAYACLGTSALTNFESRNGYDKW